MNLLELNNVSKRYGRKAILNDVTLGLPIGLTLLVGSSGAGKSTLLRLLATAETPTAGSMTWKGSRLPAARRALRRALGYAPQAVELPDDLTAREFILHMAALKGLHPGEADRQFRLVAAAIGLHDDVNSRIATYSGGMRRRLIFAQALLGAPQMLAFDEPTAELDAETAAKVEALIVEQARTSLVVMTTHLAEGMLRHANTVLRVHGGTVDRASAQL